MEKVKTFFSKDNLNKVIRVIWLIIGIFFVLHAFGALNIIYSLFIQDNLRISADAFSDQYNFAFYLLTIVGDLGMILVFLVFFIFFIPALLSLLAKIILPADSIIGGWLKAPLLFVAEKNRKDTMFSFFITINKTMERLIKVSEGIMSRLLKLVIACFVAIIFGYFSNKTF